MTTTDNAGDAPEVSGPVGALRSARERAVNSAGRRVADSPALREAVQAEVARQLAEALPRTGPKADREFTIEVMLAGRNGADRTLSRGMYKRLGEQICALTGESDVSFPLSQAYLSLLDVEARGLGRVAGWTYNILGKLVVPPLLAPPDGPILEIGTLYGLFSPALVRSFRRVGQFRHLTIIDPLAGIQLQSERGKNTDQSRTPVIESVVRRNFTEFGLAADEMRVVAGYSTDEAVKAEAADRTYSVVVIDGDHGAEGVEKDLWWVETILAPGGIAVMDDFGDKKWPGVESAARKYLADGGKLELLGTASTSGYLRMPR